MALHDISTNETRSGAQPNTHDILTENKADGTQGISQKVNTTGGAYVKTKDAQIVVNNGTVDSIQLGRLSTDQSYGMLTNDGTNNRLYIANDGTVKISKAGFDANTTGNANLIFNSNQNMFKIVYSGTISISGFSVTGAAGQYAIGSGFSTYTHNLGYIPAVIAYRVNPDGTYSPIGPDLVYAGPTAAGWAFLQTYADINKVDFYNVLMTYNSSQSAFATTIKFYLLQETAN